VICNVAPHAGKILFPCRHAVPSYSHDRALAQNYEEWQISGVITSRAGGLGNSV
jgi:hypothetical protein